VPQIYSYLLLPKRTTSALTAWSAVIIGMHLVYAPEHTHHVLHILTAQWFSNSNLPGGRDLTTSPQDPRSKFHNQETECMHSNMMTENVHTSIKEMHQMPPVFCYNSLLPVTFKSSLNFSIN